MYARIILQEHVGYAVAEKTSERANFAEIYHGLVHSAASVRVSSEELLLDLKFGSKTVID